jgi:hypothetical protein
MDSSFTSIPGLLRLTFFSICLLFQTKPSDAQDTDSFNRVVSMSSPWFIDFGHLNGDDIIDMVGVNGNSNADINIYYGNSDGTFELNATLPGSGEYYAIFVRNLNTDNVADIVAVSNISGIMYLSSPSGYVTASLPVTGIFNNLATLFADFNNDGVLDIFIKGQTLINNNDGTFTSASSIGGNGGAVATNFNNDDFQDIVMTNPGNGTVSFYKGKGDGTFETPLDKTLTVYRPIVHDLNADGLIDVIFMGYNGAIEVLYNDATYAFSQSLSFNLGHNFASALSVFDFDHDGTDDLVTSNDNDIQYRPILPDGTFGSETNFSVGMGSLRGLSYTDAIGEAFPDMVVMSGFGSTKIYSDKLNAVLQLTSTEKVYDAQTFASFYQVTPGNVATTVNYSGLANAPSDAGNYAATINVDDPNYESEPLEGTISITKKILTVDVADVSISQTEAIPSFTLLYTGFVGTDDESMLAQQPVAATSATPTSDLGEYEITISGGDDENYAFEYQTGVLTITELVLGTAEGDAAVMDVFPNPATDKISISHPQWTSVKMYDIIGRMVLARDYSNEPISLADCKPGAYILQVHLRDGKYVQRKVVVN